LKVKTTKLRCHRCGHEWSPRGEDVYKCPACRSIYWYLTDAQYYDQVTRGRKPREETNETAKDKTGN